MSFAEAIEAEPDRIRTHLAQIVDGTASAGGGPANLYSYVARGRYAEQLDRWLQYYPRERLLVLRSEDLLTDPESTYRKVLAYLELADHQPAFTRYNAARKPYAVDPEVREKLDELFAEPNRRLEQEYGIAW
jgi:hypothetical protein